MKEVFYNGRIVYLDVKPKDLDWMFRQCPRYCLTENGKIMTISFSKNESPDGIKDLRRVEAADDGDGMLIFWDEWDRDEKTKTVMTLIMSSKIAALCGTRKTLEWVRDDMKIKPYRKNPSSIRLIEMILKDDLDEIKGEMANETN